MLSPQHKRLIQEQRVLHPSRKKGEVHERAIEGRWIRKPNEGVFQTRIQITSMGTPLLLLLF